jgi:hypothetical protein
MASEQDVDEDIPQDDEDSINNQHEEPYTEDSDEEDECRVCRGPAEEE